jgi:hypothetical protein
MKSNNNNLDFSGDGIIGFNGIIVNANIVANNGASYVVVANAAFTDPISPVDGQGYNVYVRSGIATINGIGYAAGISLERIYLAGVWSNVSNSLSSYTPVAGVVASGDTTQQAIQKMDGNEIALSAIVANNTSAIATLSANSIKRKGKFANKDVIGFGSRQPTNDTLSNGTSDLSEISLVACKNFGYCTGLSVYYTNFDNIGNQSPIAASDFTLEASVEYPTGTFYRITFNGGSNTCVVKNGFGVESDPFNFFIPEDTVYWIRTLVTVTSGQFWRRNSAVYGGSNFAGKEGLITNPLGVTVMAGSIPTSTGYCYSPTAILGQSSSKKGSVLLKGDSIASGIGETTAPANSNYNTGLSGGLFGRSFVANKYPIFVSNTPGYRSLSYSRSNIPSTILYDSIFSACQFSISQLGINDIGASGMTLAILQSLILEDVFGQQTYGCKAFQTTITPRSSSTDGWATLVNQTTSTSTPITISFNTWLRDGAPLDYTTRTAVATGTPTGGNVIRVGDVRHPIVGIFDVAILAESSLNSGKWRVDLGIPTTDGLHPSSVIYAAITPAIDLTKFNV